MLRFRSERGQGSLESIGAIGVAALLVAAVIAATVQTNPAIVGNVKEGICRVVTLGQGGCDSAPVIRTADESVPPEECVIGTSGRESEAEVSLLVTLSNGETWLIESLCNGKSRLTRSKSSGLGIGAGVGFDVSVTVDALTASAEAMFKVIEGDAFYADSPEQPRDIIVGQ